MIIRRRDALGHLSVQSHGSALSVEKPLRVLFVLERNRSSWNPTLRALMTQFHEEGWSVTVVQGPKDELNGPPFPQWSGFKHLVRSRAFHITRAVFIDYLASPRSVSWLSSLWFWCHEREAFDLVIAIDRRNLVEAALNPKLRTCPLVLMSFEIDFEADVGERRKRLERHVACRIALFVVQDPVRKAALETEDRIVGTPNIIIPVGSKGLATVSPGRLRDDLGVPQDCKVAIMTGQVSAYNLVPELLMTLNAWPDEWVLLLNAPVDNALRDLENLGLRNFLENPRLYFSYAASRDVDSMSYILNGVSCGLALYSDMGDTVQFGDNVKLLGRSSGKIATYARHGIPIISNVTGLAKLDIEAFQAGIVVDRISELPQSLSNLDVESMSLNAKRYFTELLDYRLYQDHLMDEIKEILL